MAQVPGIRLLLVDDDPQILESLKCGLTRLGAEVDAFCETSGALMQLAPGRYDAVISDQVLSGALYGHEFLLAVQQVDPEAPTILMSDQALSTQEPDPKCHDAIISKPVTPFALLEWVERLRTCSPAHAAA